MNEHKFKVGETVFIADSENIPDMMNYKDTYATIIKCERLRWGGVFHNCYRIVEDKCKWAWREDWLESLYEKVYDEPEISVSEAEFETLLRSD